MFVLLLSAALSAQSYWDDPAPTGRWAASTPQLAAQLLPPELSGDAVSHVVSRPIVQGGPPFSVRFDGRVQQSNDGFCSRKTYYVSGFRETGGGGVEPTTRVVGNKVRLGGCEGIFAHLNPSASLEDGKRVLRWVKWAVQTAKSDAPLPFAVSCSDEMPYDGDRCASSARAALASLPLDNVAIITKDNDPRAHRWNVSVTDTRPGDTYWDLKVDGTPSKSSIDLRWRIPAPF